MEKMLYSRDWSRESGTGEQAQESALINYTRKLKKSLELATCDYQTSILDREANEKTKGVLAAARKLLEEINKIPEEER